RGPCLPPVSDAAVASFSASPRRRPITPPAPLSPRERGEKDPRELLLFPLLSLGERRGRGGEGRRRGNAEMKATAGSDMREQASPKSRRPMNRTLRLTSAHPFHRINPHKNGPE